MKEKKLTFSNTRWFKYDRDYLCVNKSQFVPVIFEQPCNIVPRFSIHAKYLAWKPVCEMYDISKKVKGQLYFKNFPVFYIHHSIEV
jgi:hypothetical protein